MKRTMYLIIDPDEPDVRLPLTRPVNDVICDLYERQPTFGPVLVASGVTNEPHARYDCDPDTGIITWHGRVISRANPRPRTVAQSPDAGDWEFVGIVTRTTRQVDHEGAPPEDIEEWLVEDADGDDKWSIIMRTRDARRALREAGITL